MNEAPTPAAELTRMVKARHLPARPIVVKADEAERAALAKRFGLPAITSLRAEITLQQAGKAVRADGPVNASFTQNCAVSGEPFAVTMNEQVQLKFVEQHSVLEALEDADPEIEIELTSDDLDEIEYSGDAFDLGEAVAQSLGLAIDPYAEGPGADAAREAGGIAKEGEQDGPLAEMLKGLTKG